jgi:DNA-binding transcriptional LysR family regulator
VAKLVIQRTMRPVSALASDPLSLMVPERHPLASRSRIQVAQLEGEVFISGTLDDPNRIALATVCAAAGFAPHVAFETSDYAATANLVRHGFGIAGPGAGLAGGNRWPRTGVLANA